MSCLRGLMVSELLENRATYDGYITNNEVEYEEQVKNFKQIGVYSGEIGNVMALSLTNVLRVNMVLFTSMENFPLIPISPLKKVCTHQTLYLAFNHLGSGHYDPVVEVANTSETGGDTVTTDEYSGSEDDCYGDTKEKRNEVEDVEPEESDSPTFKVAKKRSSRFVRHDGWSVTLHFKTSKTFMNLFCYASKLLLQTKAERNGMESLRRRHGDCFIKIKNPAFIAAFCTAKHLFAFTIGLSRLLRGSPLDVQVLRHTSMR